MALPLDRRSVLFAAGAAIATAAGAVGNLQAQIDRLSRAGGGLLQLPPGDIPVNRPILLRPGVVIRGDLRARSRLVAARPGMRVLDRHDGPQEGVAGLESLTVVGFGDRLSNRGDERDRAVVLGPFDHGWCRDVEVAHSRWVSLTGAGRTFEISDCYVHHGFRDGIQLNNVETAVVRGCRVERVADDGIACHVGKGARPGGSRSIIVENNRLSYCTGIKCLGASNAVIRQNYLSMTYGYGVCIGADPHFGEGYVSEHNIQINNNTFLDTLGLTEVGGGRGVGVVYVAGGAGLKDIDGHPIVHSGIRILHNVMRQTLMPQVRQVNLWWTKGTLRKPLWTDIFSEGGSMIRGVYFDGGAFSDVEIADNEIDGLATPICFDGVRSVRGGRIQRNLITNCVGPIVAPTDVEILP